LVGFDEGEGVNYLSPEPSSSSYGAKEWDNAIINLINANYKTDEARNYIQKFLRFEYRNWTLNAKTTDPSTYRSYILQVT